VKRQIIKAFLIGCGMTAFGFALVYILAWFYPDIEPHPKTSLEACLTFLMTVIFWLGWVASKIPNFDMGDTTGDLPFTIILVATALFWGGIVFIMMQIRKSIKHHRYF
jgi:hypothetical protein